MKTGIENFDDAVGAVVALGMIVGMLFVIF